MFISFFFRIFPVSINQKLALFFRNNYISNSESFSLKYIDDLLKESRLYQGIPEWMVNELEAFAKTDFNKPAKNLYLIKFNETLTTDQAECKLRELGFLPADILETALFTQKYKKVAEDKSPIISLNCYHDLSGQFKDIMKTLGRSHHDLSLGFSSYGFARPGDIESREAISNYVFNEGTHFLAKPILAAPNTNYLTAEAFTNELKKT